MEETSKLETSGGLGAVGGVALAVVLFAVLFPLSRVDYLLFHSIVEIFAVLVAFGVFVITWNTRHIVSNPYLIVLGGPQLFVGAVLILHALAYQGMGVFVGHGYTAGLAAQLWIVARLLGAGAFLVAGISLWHPISRGAVFTAFGAVTFASLVAIFVFDWFPTMYVEGVGLTPVKIAAELVVVLMATGALVLIGRSGDFFEPRVRWLLTGSILAMIGAELAFTLYVDVYGFLNFFGHYLSLGSLIMLYLAIIDTALVRPYSLLFFELRRLQRAEHEIAETLQSAILTVPERVDSLEMGHAYVSATGTARVGGDFFDLFAPAPGLVAFLIGDVCGKGIKAAAQTMIVRTTMRSFAYRDADPSYVLGRSNAALSHQFDADKFATVVYGVLESATGRMRIASAGHPEPVLCGGQNAMCVEMPPNPPLTVVPDQQFEVASLSLEQNGTLILFTDGLTDAGWRDEPFGSVRVADFATRHADLSPAEIARRLMADVQAHARGALSDDVAIVVLRHCVQPHTTVTT